MLQNCEICGVNRNLDRHHVIPKGMGGSRDPVVNDPSNLITICRQCHRNIHEGRWELVRSPEGIRILDRATGEQVMRRLYNADLDVPALFQFLNLAEESMSRLQETLPFLSDDQLVEAFAYASSFSRRSWLIRAAILHEAQQRSVYGQRSLEAIARRFEIGLRQAQKYALIWKVLFAKAGKQENVNIDVFLLEEPSWYLVAATETREPEKWLAYAQDRKAEDPRYSVAAFRREIHWAAMIKSPQLSSDTSKETASLGGQLEPAVELTQLERRVCPWIRPHCVKSGKPVLLADCQDCEFDSQKGDTEPERLEV